MKFKKPCHFNDQPDLLTLIHEYSVNCDINSSKLTALLNELEIIQQQYRFPAVDPDVGKFLSFLVGLTKPKIIFEFGSGYGHSAFWYFENGFLPEKVYLTEKRDDLESVFQKINWPKKWKQRMEYHQGDAFDKFKSIKNQSVDLLLLDGQKAQYLDFLNNALEEKLSDSGAIVIDNAFWRGEFLDSNSKKNRSNQAIAELHDFIGKSGLNKSFLPVSDGLILLTR